MTPERNDAARRVLAASVFGCALATGFQSLNYGGGPLMTVLWLDLGWSEGAAEATVDTLSWVGLIAGTISLWGRAWPAAYLVAAWLLAITVATMIQRPQYVWLVPFAHATRYLAPVALVLLWRAAPRGATAILRVAAAATFAAHGIEALLLQPAFVDYVIIFGRDFLGVEPSMSTVNTALYAIGLIDLAVAVAILSTRWRGIAAYMALWGAITAASRIVHSGFGAWDQALLRLPNVGVPLALWLLFRKSPTDSPRETAPV